MSRQLHYNSAQIKCLVQYPKRLIGVMGRGTGKSTGIIAPRLKNCIIEMPESNNGLVAKTFKQIKSRTLPATMSGWKKLGFHQDIHYVVGTRADKKLRFPLPDESPSDWEHVIHWFTGAIISLSSQDRKNDSNGLNLQSLHGDEAKLLDYDDLTESIMPTLRGMPKFKDKIEYRMQTFTSDMPTTPSGKWLIDCENECDQDVVNLLFQYQILLQNKQAAFESSTSATYRTRLAYEISTIEKKMHELRKGHTYYIEATSFDNIDMLTPEYFHIQKRNLPDFTFHTSILNKRPKGVEIGKMFYPHLSSKHFYTDYNYNYLDQFKIDLPEDKDTCLGDNDVEKDCPLDGSIDWGGNINSMLVNQESSIRNEYKTLKEFFALAEDGEHIRHLIEKFVKYYEPHPTKHINLFYDRNGNSKVANSDETYAELAERLLYSAGWTVTLMSYEENPHHSDKYKFFILAMSGSEDNLPQIKINSGNCPNLEIALFNAPTKIVTGTVRKNKNSEDMSSGVPQQQATHITDAFDYAYYTRFRDRIDNAINSLVGMIF